MMIQATNETEQESSPSPYLPGDSSAVSLSYLAQISSDVYNDDHDYNNKKKGVITEVGPDRFAVYEHERTLFVAICGTSSPFQHVMNVMPHAFSGLHLVGQALSTKDGASASASTNSTNTNTTRSHTTANKTHRDAYREGDEQGWKDPARSILEEVLRVVSSASNANIQQQTTEAVATKPATTNNNDNTPNDRLNERYERIVFTGHSRGGLLGYHAAVACSEGSPSQPPYKGSLLVVGFGMPPPLSPPSKASERALLDKGTVFSVVHRDDPVSNGKLLRWCPGWNPTTLYLSPTPQELAEQARKLAEQQAEKEALAASARGRGGGFWGALGNLAVTAVKAVGNTAAELKSSIDEHHMIDGYVDKVKRGIGELQPPPTSETAAVVVVERRSSSEEPPLQQAHWALVFR